MTNTDIPVTITDTTLTATLGRKKVSIPLDLDLDQLFDLLDGVEAFDSTNESDNPMEMMRALRAVIPTPFREATKGIPAPQALSLFMHYIEALGNAMGKALT